MIQLISGERQALFLSILLLLSLVHPFMVKAAGGKDMRNHKSRMRTVWIGPLSVAMGGLLIVLLPSHPGFGFVIAMTACCIFTFKLRGQLSAAHAVRGA